MIKKINSLTILILVNLLYIIPAIIIFANKFNMEFIAYLGIVILLGVLFVNLVKKKFMQVFELWLLSIWGFLHIMGGLLVFPNGKVLYQQMVYTFLDKGGGFVLLKMDQVIHFYGFGLVAFIMYRVLKERLNDNSSSLFAFIFAVICAVGFGAMNELVEFIVVLSTEFNGVGDLFNMGFDLIFNFIGAIFGAGLRHYLMLK